MVRINAALSDALPVRVEWPQGSVFGTLLFSIYVNDLPAVSEVCSTACYVENMKLILSFTVDEYHAAKIKSTQTYNESVIGALRTTSCWTQQMICKLPSFKLSFFGKELLTTNSIKDLGVIFDTTLSFDSHITALAAACPNLVSRVSLILSPGASESGNEVGLAQKKSWKARFQSKFTCDYN